MEPYPFYESVGLLFGTISLFLSEVCVSNQHDVSGNKAKMRTYKTIILLAVVGAIFIWGGSVLFLIEDAYWTTKPNKIKLEQAVFLGDWRGATGTVISIRSDGKADYRNYLFSVQDANIEIEGNRLLINVTGFEKNMTIEEPPRLGRDGLWRMRLNGEIFLKQSHDLFVRKDGTYTGRGSISRGLSTAGTDKILFAEQFSKVVSEKSA